VETKAKDVELDLDDPYTQKLIFDDLSKQIDRIENSKDLKLNFDKIARQSAMSQKDYANESRIFENKDDEIVDENGIDECIKFIESIKNRDVFEVIDEAIEDDSEMPIDVSKETKIKSLNQLKIWFQENLKINESKKFFENSAVPGNQYLRRSLPISKVSDDSDKKTKGSALKNILKSFWDKVIWFLKKLNTILKTINRAIGSVISWICRKIFGASNITTKRVKNWIIKPIYGIIIATLVVIFFKIIIGTVAFSFTSILSAIWSFFSTNSWYNIIGWVFFLFRQSVKSYYDQYYTTDISFFKKTIKPEIDPNFGNKRRVDQTLFLGFLDNLEKCLNKKFKLSERLRQFIENLDNFHIKKETQGVDPRYQTTFGAKISGFKVVLENFYVIFDAIFNQERENRKNKIPLNYIEIKMTLTYGLENDRMTNFLDNIIKNVKIEYSKNQNYVPDFVELTGFPEGIPIFNELAKGLPVTNESIGKFTKFINERWLRNREFSYEDIFEYLLSLPDKQYSKNFEMSKQNLENLAKAISPQIKCTTQNSTVGWFTFQSFPVTSKQKIDTNEEYVKLRNDQFGIL
jgi:hypothetical protein